MLSFIITFIINLHSIRAYHTSWPSYMHNLSNEVSCTYSLFICQNKWLVKVNGFIINVVLTHSHYIDRCIMSNIHYKNQHLNNSHKFTRTHYITKLNCTKVENNFWFKGSGWYEDIHKWWCYGLLLLSQSLYNLRA